MKCYEIPEQRQSTLISVLSPDVFEFYMLFTESHITNQIAGFVTVLSEKEKYLLLFLIL